LLFTPLPAVDGQHVFFNTQWLHFALDLQNLALIRCDEAEFIDIVLSLLFQVLKKFRHIIDFTHIEEGIAKLLFLFLAINEKHRSTSIFA
jgi:hypothetical protein